MSLTDSTHSHSNQVKMNKHSEGSHSAPLQAKVFGQTSTNAPRAALGNITNNVKTTTREALKPLKAVQPTNRVQVYKVRPPVKRTVVEIFFRMSIQSQLLAQKRPLLLFLLPKKL